MWFFTAFWCGGEGFDLHMVQLEFSAPILRSPAGCPKSLKDAAALRRALGSTLLNISVKA